MEASYWAKKLGPDEVIPIVYDKCFKMIFADSNHLERVNLLLSSILKKDVKVVTLLNPELFDSNRKNKKNTLDLVCKLDNEYVSIEVNTSFGKDVIDRNLLFLFRLSSKELRPGEDYTEISKYYQINLNRVNFDNEPFNICSLRSKNTGKTYSNIIQIININVSYYADLCYDNKEEKRLSDEDQVLGIIGTNKKSVIDKIIDKNKKLKEIGKMAQFFSNDDEIIFEYNRDKLMMQDMKKVLTQEITDRVTKDVTKKVTDKVTNEVTAKVSATKSKEIALKMLDKDMDSNTISELTGLTKDEVEQLKDKLLNQ